MLEDRKIIHVVEPKNKTVQVLVVVDHDYILKAGIVSVLGPAFSRSLVIYSSLQC